MSDIIQQLPDSIANQIAAGEVIQRPASAVKELMENAIDAGATSVKLIIKDAGKTLLQVIDNGCGMSETDARMSFERHATSKIKNIDDLFHIRTMGFRGEALASIAAVAQVELKSKMTGEELGTQLIIEGSEVKSQEPVQCAEGTSIAVKNLFYNVPARRNFLKSPPVEMRHIIDEFQRIALSYPHIHFTLHHNGMEIFHLKAGNLRQRIVSIFGSNYNERLVPIEENTNITNIIGFIGKPEFAKKTRGEQFLFVNNRFIRSNYLNHAIVNAYDELLPRDSYPLYVLFIDIEPSRIDINVHPTKQEIKFEDEKIIYAFVNSATKRALGKYSVSPTLDFDSETAFGRLESFSRSNAVPQQNYSPAESDSQTANKLRTSFPSKGDLDDFKQSNLKQWEKLYEGSREERTPGEPATFTIPSRWEAETATHHPLISGEEKESSAFQVHEKFIVSQIKSGFILVDQQAAHERVLFEKYLNQLEKNIAPSQQQLFPQTLQLSPSDFLVAKEILTEIRALGFDLQEFGNNALVLHGIPADVLEGNELKMLEQIIEGYKESQTNVQLDKREELAKLFAKNSAIKNGTPLTEKEMKGLLDQLFGCEFPMSAPDGRLTFITFNLKEIEKQFEKK